MRYTLFTADDGGILDDLMVTRVEDGLFLVVNAACKEADFAHLQKYLPSTSTLQMLEDRALLAFQGPDAVLVLERLAPAVAKLSFMTATEINVAGIPCFISRSGYTGEDGFEISVAADRAHELAVLLLDAPEVAPIGLGARDSLRLEAGLCLYGHDIDPATTPVEAGLSWAIGKRRRSDGGFPGADHILAQLKDGVPRKRVGILPEGRAPAREHTEIRAPGGGVIGEITSGGFGPTVGGPVAMGYVTSEFAQVGSPVELVIRGKARPAKVVKLPFAPHNYVKKN
jgi:aminomethyltransferase